MTIFNRMVFPLVVILAAALGAESYTRIRVAEDLRQQIQGLSDQLIRADATATKAGAAAETAADKAAALADQARASAAEARQIVDQAAARAMPPREAAAPVGPDMLTGKALATLLCAVCHVVSSDQPTEPLRQPPAPDFRRIASRPGTTDASLRDFLARPHGPNEKMPDQGLMDSQVTVLTGYILSLRNQ